MIRRGASLPSSIINNQLSFINALVICRPAKPWVPFDEFDRAMNRILGDLYPTRAEYPPVNIWKGKDDTGDRHLFGGRKGASPPEGVTYHRRECAHAGFSRSWRLPFAVDPDQVEARLENGVLKLILPQSKEAPPQKIAVKAG